MVASNSQEFQELFDRIASWPADMRLEFAQRVLAIVDVSDSIPRRGYRAAEAAALIQSHQPAPDDATVEKWIDEHRMEKYGR